MSTDTKIAPITAPISKDQKTIMNTIKSTLRDHVRKMLWGKQSEEGVLQYREALDFGRQYVAFASEQSGRLGIAWPKDVLQRVTIANQIMAREDVKDEFAKMIISRCELFLDTSTIMNNNAGRLQDDVDPRSFAVQLLFDGETKREQKDKLKNCTNKELAEAQQSAITERSIRGQQTSQSAIRKSDIEPVK